MTRHLKALGLALVAAFAFSAVAAAGASAKEEGHIVGENTAGLHVTTFVEGEDKAGARLKFTAGEQVVTCTENTFSGEISGGTTKELTLTADFGGTAESCLAGGLPATVDENNCHLTFYTAQTGLGSHEWTVLSKVTCPAGVAGIQVTVFSSSSHAFRVCTLTVPPQSGLKGVTVHNNTEGAHDDLTATVGVTGITETQTGLCGHKANSASFEGQVTMTGEDVGGNPVHLRVEHTK